jgi:hypothetical protein
MSEVVLALLIGWLAITGCRSSYQADVSARSRERARCFRPSTRANRIASIGRTSSVSTVELHRPPRITIYWLRVFRPLAFARKSLKSRHFALAA